MKKKTFSELYAELDGAETPKQRFRREVAEATGKKDQTVKQWLSGSQIPTRDTILKIAELLDADPDFLFDTPKEDVESNDEDKNEDKNENTNDQNDKNSNDE